MDAGELKTLIAKKKARKDASSDLLDALYLALPFVEDHADSDIYKPGAVNKAIKQIKEAINKAEGK